MGKSQSKQLTSETKDGNFVRFALVGSGGCGKSAFVNAVRSVDDEDEQAASVDIVDTGQQPKEYTYPSNPYVSFGDLPGYGTSSYPDVETYCRKLQLQKFDIFLIFISSRVTALDLAIIQKVQSMKKAFLLIRTKIDVECMTKKNKSQVKEEELLIKIKDYIVGQTSHLSGSEEDIFLISSYDPYKWDFFRLIEAIINMMPDPEMDPTSHLTEQYMADARKYIKENGVSGIEEFLREKLQRMKDVKIRFGITGDSGTGKSAFINAIRGLKDDDDGAADVGVTETTKEPTEYQHPDNLRISFVDLPGIGTPNYRDLPTYCEKVGLEDYDTFLIFTAGRFTQNDLALAEKVKSIGKSFFLIRTKIDVDCMSKEGKKQVNESETMKKIRQNCMVHVKYLISSEKEIFLISNYDKDKWDFDRLIEAISDALPILQRECLTLSLSNIMRECLKRKAKIFKAQAVAVAALSAATGAIPIPGVGGAIDVILIGGTIMVYYRQFGLNNVTPEEQNSLKKNYRKVIQRYGFRQAADFAATFAPKTLGKLFGVEEVATFIPIIGIVIASSISFAFTFRYLLQAINELEETAIAVWDNAARQSIEDSLETRTDNLQLE